MLNGYILLAGLSVLVLLLWLLAEAFVSRRFRILAIVLAVALVLLLAVLAVVVVRMPTLPELSGVESKGDTPSTAWAMIALMYVAMALGIVAQSYYFSENPPSAAIGGWIKPALASPIIFIPLLSSYQSALAGLDQISIPQLMILLVSFQNGFFWKVVFDKQAEAIARHPG